MSDAWSRPPDRRSLSPQFNSSLALVSMLAIVATLGFRGALTDWAFVTSAGLGALGAGLVIVASTRFRLFVGESVAVSALAFVLLGGPASIGLPSPAGYRTFVSGLLNGWSDLLSSAPPADLTAELRVLPYAIAWSAVLIGGELIQRTPQPLLPIVGPAAGLVTTMLLTVEDERIATVQGVTLALGAIGLGLAQQANWTASEATDDSPVRRTGPRTAPRTMARTAGLMSLVTVAAATLGPHLPLAEANDRFDLRRYQEQPWNPLTAPSPLVTLKASLKEGRSNQIVFNVHSEEPITRWSLAVLGDYNGVVWSVADEGVDIPARFQPVDSVFPDPPADINRSSPASYEIEIGDLGGVWLPVAGFPRAAAVAYGTDLRLNPATGTLALPDGLTTGLRLRMAAYLRPELSDVELLGSTIVSNDDDAELAAVPPKVRNLAGDLFEGVEAGSSRAVVLANKFVLQGFYDHSDSAQPGHSLARIDEFLGDPERLVGFAEQYAGSAGVLARIGGVPSRIVVGYVIPADRYRSGRAPVRAEDITAWIEIETVEHGWVPLTVTPDRTREPKEEQLGTTIKEVVIPNPPPAPPPQPEVEASTRAAETGEESEDETEEETILAATHLVPTPALVAGTALGTPLILLVLPAGAIVAAKRFRSRRRRGAKTPEERIAGAWHELVDRYHEAGIVAGAAATPTESVAAFVEAEPTAALVERELVALAEHIDRAAFHPQPANDEQVESAWSICRLAIDDLTRDRSRWARACMRTDPRPLLPIRQRELKNHDS